MFRGNVSFQENLPVKWDVSRIVWHSESPKDPSRPIDEQALLAALTDIGRLVPALDLTRGAFYQIHSL